MATHDTRSLEDLTTRALRAWRSPYAESVHDLWTRTNVGEVFPRALTPLTYSIVDLLGQRLFSADPKRAGGFPPDLIRGGVLPAIFRVINGRMFYNAGLMHHLFTDRFGMPSWFWMMGLGGPQDPTGAYFDKQPFRPLLMLRGLPYILRESGRQRRSVAAFHRDHRRMEAEALALAREPLDQLDAEALVARLERIIELAQPSQAQLLDGSAMAVSAFGMLAGLCGRWLADPGLANDLVTGSGAMQTANATLALWQVAECARDVPAARHEILTAPPAEIPERLRSTAGAHATWRAYTRFLRDFGHRCVDEFELSNPRWAEQPDLPVATLRGYLTAPPSNSPARLLARQRRRRREAAHQARSRLVCGRHRLIPYRWAVLRWSLGQARELLPLRENPKHLFLRYLAEVRRTVLALAGRLGNAGILAEAADVFFLTREELRVLAESAARGDRPTAVQELIDERRRLYQRFEAWTPPDAIPARSVAPIERAVLNDWPHRSATNEQRPTGASGRLSGLAASRGVVTGRARVALTPEEGAAIEPGEILVAPFTDPGWTPLFAIAGAIVMDLGGLLSHGAIVAREYGIPAVVNTRSATSSISTGQRITVDGQAGTVTWDTDCG